MWHLTFTLAVTGAAALSVTPPLLPRGLTTLGARQIDPSQFPAQCQAPCGPVTSELQSCTTNACTCTDTVAGDYQTCLNCLGNLAVTSGINVSSDIQNAVSTFNQQCAGFHIVSITAPPGSVSTSGGSLSGGLSATGTNFPSATGLSSGAGFPTGTGAPTFGSSSLGGLGGGGVSTGFGGAGSIPLSTQTAATLPAAGGVGATATGTGVLSGTATASAGYKEASVRLIMVFAGLIGAAVPYFC